MNSMKCKSCGLVNFSTDDVCRRCAGPLSSAVNRGGRLPRRISITPILLVAVVGIAAYYFYGSSTGVPSGNANLGTTTDPQAPALSRTEYDRARAAQYKNAVANSNSFTQSQKHNEDLHRAMQQASNSSK